MVKVPRMVWRADADAAGDTISRAADPSEGVRASEEDCGKAKQSTGEVSVANIRYGVGKNAVIMSDDMDRLFRRLLERIAPTVLREMEATVETLRDNAAKQWPVKTGESKSKLQTALRIVPPGKLEAVVYNTASYVYFIRSDKVGKAPKLLVPIHAWTELVRKPGEKMAQPLADRLRDDLQRLAESK